MYNINREAVVAILFCRRRKIGGGCVALIIRFLPGSLLAASAGPAAAPAGTR